MNTSQKALGSHILWLILIIRRVFNRVYTLAETLKMSGYIGTIPSLQLNGVNK